MIDLIDFLREFDVPTLVGFGVICWFMMRSFRYEIQQEIKEVRKEIVMISSRTDRLYEMFIELLKEKR